MSQTLTPKPTTIFAWATASGRAGVAVLRISGSEALEALLALGVTRLLTPRHASLVRLISPSDGALIDEALALYFPAPHSFTGEEVVELHTHGSPAVIRLLTEALLALPHLRLAEAGEFSRRAFLSGKFDLLAAEGLADLINAETEAQHRQAMRQMQGQASQHYHTLRTQLIEAMAMLEAYIDFPDEDIPEEVIAQGSKAVSDAINTIRTILGDDRIGEKIRDGLRVVILGAPNVGKSSLLNALARRDVAIVSHQAGTTRDVIQVELDLNGYRIILTDTAGIRETEDAIENEGIRRALQQAESADIKLILYDATALPQSDDSTLALADENSLIIINKTDLISDNALPDIMAHHAPIAISLKHGTGLSNLIDNLSQLAQKNLHSAHQPLITQTRHRQTLLEALAHLDRYDSKAPLELATEDLRMAAQSLAKMTGKIAIDDILDVVFARFCIGK